MGWKDTISDDSGGSWRDSIAEEPQDKPWYDVSAKGLARGALDAIPAAGGIAGGILGAPVGGPIGAVGGAGLGYAGGKELSDILKNKFLGDEADSTDPLDQLKRVGESVKSGAMQEMGGQIGADVLGRGMDAAKQGVNSLGNKLKSAAEKLAVNATGATGSQASKFADDAGRELLDRGLVKFGDTPEAIAGRTSGALDSAHADIDSSLSALDKQGVTASSDNVIANLNQKIDQLKRDPSQAGIVRKLQGIVEDIKATGINNVPISEAEMTKRGFNKMAGNWMDPEVGQAGKQAYLSYMDEAERAANAADPNLASKFQSGKETHGLLAPIEEAAARRASTQNQSPLGGLGDFVAGGSGAALGGGPGAVAGVAAKKFIAPRAASSGAVSLDKISKFLMNSPKLAAAFEKNPQALATFASRIGGSTSNQLPKVAEKKSKPYDQREIIQKTQGTKYQQALNNAAQRGEQAFGAAHFVLQAQDPDYRKLTVTDESEDPDGGEYAN